MSDLHKFLFEGLPVRGMLVRLTDSWREVLQRREAGGGYPAPVRQLLGEMTAAAVLMQSNIKFNGALVMQIFGDGPVKMAVVEVQPELHFRTTAKVVGEVAEGAGLEAMLNVHNRGRCAITLDPRDRQPGQQPYQGVVPLSAMGEEFHALQDISAVLEQYMRQSEQLETRLVLAANDEVAAGLLIQRLPIEGEGNLESKEKRVEAEMLAESFNRIAHLAGSLTKEELLTLDAETILHRLFWEEDVRRFEPQQPRFACTCSRERVGAMLKGLGRDEIDSIVAERGEVEIGCDFCGRQYHFDVVDVGELFTPERDQPPSSTAVQ